MPATSASENKPRSIHLGQAVLAAIEGAGMTQVAFSKLAGFDTSKTSRIVNGRSEFDVTTLEAIIKVFPDKTTKFYLIDAYLKDVTTPAVREHITVLPKSAAKPKELDCSGLSPEGLKALRYILKLAAEGQSVDNMFIGFAQAVGLKK